MSLPTSRDLTYIPGSTEVSGNNLNSLQDMVIGAKHGVKTIHVPAMACHSATMALFGVIPTSWFYWAGVGAGAGGHADAPLIVELGQRILAVRAHVKDTTGSNTVNLKVAKYTKTTITQLGSTQTSVGDASEQVLAVTGLTEVVVADTFYCASVANDTGTDTTNRLYGIEFDVDKV